MDGGYWQSRRRAALAMAERAADPRARQVHLELADRYAEAASAADYRAPAG